MLNPQLFSKIRHVEPYIPGEQPQQGGFIKLNTNENPYPPSPRVLKVFQSLGRELLPRYPDPETAVLSQAIANHYGLEKDQVFTGNGSDEVLALAFMTFFNSELPVLFPDVTYSFYKVWCELYNIPYRTPLLSNSFKINLDDYTAGENGGVVLANPNAPTAIYEDLSFIEAVLSANRDCIVIVDEAYIDFGGVSALSLINSYENLLVVHTMSKYRGLAGARISYAMGDRYLIGCLNDVKNSFNSYTMDVVAQAMGTAAIKDEDYYRSRADELIQTRNRFSGEMRDMGFVLTDSMTNFVFATHHDYKAEQLYDRLRQENILVRYLTGERTKNHLRISIGTEEDMKHVVNALKKIMK